MEEADSSASAQTEGGGVSPHPHIFILYDKWKRQIAQHSAERGGRGLTSSTHLHIVFEVTNLTFFVSLPLVYG